MEESESRYGFDFSYENSHAEQEDMEERRLNQEFEDHYEQDSQKSDQIDDGTMNVFGFNDDLNLDDRVII